MRILALVDSASRGAVADAAARLNGTATLPQTLSALLSALQTEPYAGVILSLDGESLPAKVVQGIAHHAHCGAILLSTSEVTLDRALFADRTGSLALLREPLQAEDVVAHLETVAAEGAEVPLPEPVSSDDGLPAMIGSGAAMASVFETLARVANSAATVLVTGESGTGKEVVARVLHTASDRKRAPFVAVNCAAIPEQLLESELFGHRRGAFTGAVANRAGRIERAHGGTLFLDEIGDMSPVLQAKVLRVLEERSLEPVGGDRPVDVDVRIVAATNQDLSAGISSGTFREDLYYRLAVVEIELPPLRERGSDVRALALHFAAEFSRRHEREIGAISEKALFRLEAYEWPGNVRELRNVIDRAVVLTTDSVIQANALRLGPDSPRASPRGVHSGAEAYPVEMTLAEVEAAHITRVLSTTGGHMGRAAESLGIHRNTLTRKVRDYGLDDEGDS